MIELDPGFQAELRRDSERRADCRARVLGYLERCGKAGATEREVGWALGEEMMCVWWALADLGDRVTSERHANGQVVWHAVPGQAPAVNDAV